MGVGRHQKQEQEQTRQQAAGPPLIEAQKAQIARAGPFGHQQRGDEIAREHEEDVHAEQAAAESGHAGVEAEHADDRYGSDAVQPGDVVARRGGGGLDVRWRAGSQIRSGHGQ